MKKKYVDETNTWKGLSLGTEHGMKKVYVLQVSVSLLKEGPDQLDYLKDTRI